MNFLVGYRSSSRVRDILLLPGSAPEFNLEENIGQFMRDNFLANHVFYNYEEILAQCCEA